MDPICEQYHRRAEDYDRARSRSLMEAPYLDALVCELEPGAPILDLGCGTGEPIARYLVDAGFRVTGIDGAASMVELCRQRFAGHTFVQADMVDMPIGTTTYAAVVAWDSFFHLSGARQRLMFPRFQQLVRIGGRLLFTSGTRESEVTGTLCGEPLYHASLDTSEYRSQLADHGFRIVSHTVEDPNCGHHTIWLAERVAT